MGHGKVLESKVEPVLRMDGSLVTSQGLLSNPTQIKSDETYDFKSGRWAWPATESGLQEG